MANQGQGLPFQIRVIEGDLSQATLQDGQPPGVIQLVGPAAPFKPYKVGGTQRVQTVNYPGNPVATQQPVGPTEGSSTVTGEWHDWELGDGESMRLREVFDNIRRRGLSVEVIWPMSGIGGSIESPTFTGNPIVRVGMMTEFWATIGMVTDVAWEAKFDWRSQGEQASKPISATGALNPRDGFEFVSDDLDVARATWQSIVDGPLMKNIGLPQSVTDKINRAYGKIDAAQATISNATGTVTSALVIPAQAAQALLGACSNGMEAMLDIQSSVLGVKLTYLEVRDSALDLIRLKDELFSAFDSFDKAAATCQDAAAGVAVNLEPDIIGEVRVPAGTDTRDLAIKFYGDPDLHWLIDNFNGFESSAVPSPPDGPSDSTAGRTIKIPRPQPGTASDLRAQC